MALELLCAADFHLGRPIRQLPEGIDGADCSPRKAWERFIDLALKRRPLAVLLAGDIVDKDNRYYETFPLLEDGIGRLDQNGVRVVAVAGNHDHEPLTQMAGRIEGFTLLGAQGRWEQQAIEADGRPALLLRGWSFDRDHVLSNPFDDYDFAPGGDVPVVGLLHGDLGASQSRYAPFQLSDLQRTQATAWVLGHTHTPGVRSEQSPLAFYCGSPQGLDPSETGTHGAWLLRVDSPAKTSAEQLALAGLRWEVGEVKLDEVTDEDDFREALHAAIPMLNERILVELGPARVVGCRLTLTGRSRAHRQAEDWAEQASGQRARNIDGIDYFVDKIINQAQPDLALDQMARANDLPGLLARKLLLLENQTPAEDYRALLDQAQRKLHKTWDDSNYQTGEAEELSDQRLRETLLRAGAIALDGLLKTKRDAS